ncbi:MerR family transcriptional regulator [Candidatus Peregrinibacteria bacterium]|nr:MerR family transcriptional regulator [Candidatus Peregrinibacteria bacterium]
MKNDTLLSIGATAKFLGVSLQTLRRWDNTGILKSFRVAPRGKRFYKPQDIKIFLHDLPAIGWKWALEPLPSEPVQDFYCPTSDVFIARLTRLENDLQTVADLGIHHSLLTSMVGEIGDNSYAHNLGNWPDILGIFFAYDLNKRVIVLADRGRGILKTLQFVRPGLSSHAEALKVAFTEIISGRFPERRGNGLKSVAQNIVTSDVRLTFRTGNAELNLKKEDSALNITECEIFHGCFAVFNF